MEADFAVLDYTNVHMQCNFTDWKDTNIVVMLDRGINITVLSVLRAESKQKGCAQ